MGVNTPLGLFSHLVSASFRTTGAVEFRDIAKPTAPRETDLAGFGQIRQLSSRAPVKQVVAAVPL